MHHRVKLNRTLLATLATVGLAAAPAIQAAPGDAPRKPMAQPAPMQDVEVADAEIEQFANAYIQTQRVKAQYRQKIQNAGDDQTKRQLQQEAQKQILGVIQQSPLSVDRYRTIAQATQQDQELKQDVIAKIREVQGIGQRGGGGDS